MVPFSLTMNLFSPFSCCISNLRPHPHVSGHFGNGDFFLRFSLNASSETQGQIVGARESLNGRKNMARRKVKNGEKSPWGQCLTRPLPNGRRRSAF